MHPRRALQLMHAKFISCLLFERVYALLVISWSRLF